MDENKFYVGIDIGSTASKTAVIQNGTIVDTFVLPTGWNSKETADHIRTLLEEKGYCENMRCVATGYGRVSVDFADKVVTEITCHGRGGWELFHKDGTIIDVGGQDTKAIRIQSGQVKDFLMNDKCAAGTGKFIEVMANRLGVGITEFFDLAQSGKAVSISAMCTVFAESEVIGYIGSGTSRWDIAAGVAESVAVRVANLLTRLGHQPGEALFLTGGLCDSPYFLNLLTEKTGCSAATSPLARYAGAIGAAHIAAKESGGKRRS